MLFRLLLTAGALAFVFASPASARTHHHHHRHHHHGYHHNHHDRARVEAAHYAESGQGSVVGGRPAGCPSRFCGCGASLHLFGRIIPSLNLASNWLRFPRTSPAPRMVAVRPGHVFVLEHQISGSLWVVHDSNSGGQRTRVHPRSIAGYTIVDPHGAA